MVAAPCRRRGLGTGVKVRAIIKLIEDDGVTYDPRSVNPNTDKDSYCKRVRDTTTVKCHDIRSISFT